MVIERLDDGAKIESVGLHAEDAHSTHAVERLEDDVAVLRMEGLHVLRLPRDERGRGKLGELHHGELLRMVAQRRGLVEDARTLALGLLEQVRGVDVLGIEGRVLAL